MSAADNGGPAFPVPLNPGQSWRGMAPCDGMTLRDYFAGKAMQVGLYEGSEVYRPSEFAKWCYEMADAMLKARNGGAA